MIRRFFIGGEKSNVCESLPAAIHDECLIATEKCRVNDEALIATEVAGVNDDALRVTERRTVNNDYRVAACYGDLPMAMDKEVLKVCQECAMRHLDDIEVALAAIKRQLKIPQLPDWIMDLVNNALREQIHYARHASNRRIRKDNGAYGGPGKVGASSALGDVAEAAYRQSVFNHTISGWLLGDIAKTDLIAFAEVEDSKAAGSVFNASLCRACYKACAKRNGTTVRECLKEKEVEVMFKTISKQLGRDAA